MNMISFTDTQYLSLISYFISFSIWKHSQLNVLSIEATTNWSCICLRLFWLKVAFNEVVPFELLLLFYVFRVNNYVIYYNAQ